MPTNWSRIINKATRIVSPNTFMAKPTHGLRVLSKPVIRFWKKLFTSVRNVFMGISMCENRIIFAYPQKIGALCALCVISTLDVALAGVASAGVVGAD